MTEQYPMSDDMFEKARVAFFGTAKISPQQSHQLAEFVSPQDEPMPTEFTGPSSNEHEAT